MAKWRRAVALQDFDTAYKFVYRRKEIAVFKLEEGVFAVDNACSHEYSELSQGYIMDGHDVTCPKHGSRFDIRTGEVRDFPATEPVKTYEVKIEDGVVYVKV